MILAKDISTESERASEVSGFTTSLKRIIELLDLEEDDDYGILKPAEYAFKKAMQLVIGAYEIMGDKFPESSISTDEQGAIRLAWESQDETARLRLFCPASPERQAYIYHQRRDEYGSEREVSASTLVSWLEWLN